MSNTPWTCCPACVEHPHQTCPLCGGDGAVPVAVAETHERAPLVECPCCAQWSGDRVIVLPGAEFASPEEFSDYEVLVSCELCGDAGEVTASEAAHWHAPQAPNEHDEIPF